MQLDRFIRELRERRPAVASPPPSGSPLPKGDSSNLLKESSTSSESDKATAAEASHDALDQFKQRIHSLLVDKLDPEHVKAIPEERQRAEMSRIIENLVIAENQPLTLNQKRSVIEDILDDALGFGPLERLLRDPSINDILINGAHSIYIERGGVLQEELSVRFRDDVQLLEVRFPLGRPNAELSAMYTEAGRFGDESPAIIVRSHRHRYIKVQLSAETGESSAVVTPGWQLKNSLRLEDRRCPHLDTSGRWYLGTRRRRRTLHAPQSVPHRAQP